LGVTKAAVSKTMKKLEIKGFIKRYKNFSNNKEIFVSITDLGDRIYQNYQNYIYENLFKEIFQLLYQNNEKSYEMLKHFFKSADRSFQKISKDKLAK
jgi:DNA-binding MarR family transcriptional regulator